MKAKSLYQPQQPLRRWVLRCHTTNWESQRGPLFGLLHRLCIATVITTIIWLPKTSNGGLEAAGICIAAFDLRNLNNASSSSAKQREGYKVLPPFRCTFCLNHLYCCVILATKATERQQPYIKTNITQDWPGSLFVYSTQTETDNFANGGAGSYFTGAASVSNCQTSVS